MSQVNDDLYARFSQEFQELGKDPQKVIIEMTKLQAWELFCQLQLALRHPMNRGATSEFARGLARQLQLQLATTPALWEVSRKGWNEEYDHVEVPGAPQT